MAHGYAYSNQANTTPSHIIPSCAPIPRLPILQGTPVQNVLGELWALLHFLHPDRFDCRESFLAAHGDLSTPAARASLHDALRPHMLRRTKEDVMKALPAKHEVVVPVPLTPVQAELYRLVLNKNYELLRLGLGAGSKAKGTLNNILMELRKVRMKTLNRLRCAFRLISLAHLSLLSLLSCCFTALLPLLCRCAPTLTWCTMRRPRSWAGSAQKPLCGLRRPPLPRAWRRPPLRKCGPPLTKPVCLPSPVGSCRCSRGCYRA